MDRGAWRAIVHEIERGGHDWVTEHKIELSLEEEGHIPLSGKQVKKQMKPYLGLRT